MAFGSRYWNPQPVFCGCYYLIASTDTYIRETKQYLPLLDSQVHSTILSTTSRTVLTQTFTNPSASEAIKECVYVFPLYDGVSVVSFTCRIGNKVLTGLVKAKEKAKQIFDQAVARGETAGLLEQAPESSDIFSTKLGNIPKGQSVVVEIVYVGELKHHETEGIRFTIPTKIAPRYGPATSYGTNQANSARDNSGIKITVDVNMPEGSFIKGVQSPSHPIAVSMGTISTSTNSDPVMSKASATLALGSSALDQDFVLIIQSKDVGAPKALLETHPTIPNQRALMVTLVPKFSLPPSRPEIVFVADRSGSMGNSIPMLISAMNVFLKSMPAGVKFNICSFGSSYSFLWPKSESYTKESLTYATQHVQTFSANMGGTETFNAVKATIDHRYGDLPLEIILLTDGDISRQNELFAYVNQKVKETDGNIRVFPLGIGNGVSHALIEGLARAGDGFAQAVQNGERLDNAVVRMLRGALSPHIKNYTLEVKYEPESNGEEEIDFVTEGMKVLLSDDERSIRSEKSLRSEKPLSQKPKATISLFDTAVDPEKEDVKGLNDSKFWLPHIPHPKLLQAPHKIPSLYAFSRTTAYLLMSEETCQRKPISVTLRGTSAHGPLALEIAVEVLAVEGETIHQLAAKKAVQDLEEGRGWIYDAKDQNGVLVKERYPSRFDDLVEQEAVRLGEKFQIAGKWCSFVAVAANDKEIAAKKAAQRERRSSSKHELSSEESSTTENDREEEDEMIEQGMTDEDDFEVVSMPKAKSSTRTAHKSVELKGFRERAKLQAPVSSSTGLLQVRAAATNDLSLSARKSTKAQQPKEKSAAPPDPTAQMFSAHSPNYSPVSAPGEGSMDVLQDFDFDSFLHMEQPTGYTAQSIASQPQATEFRSHSNASKSQRGGSSSLFSQSTGGGLFGSSSPSSTGGGLFGSATPQSTGSTNPFGAHPRQYSVFNASPKGNGNPFGGPAQPASSIGFGSTASPSPSTTNVDWSGNPLPPNSQGFGTAAVPQYQAQQQSPSLFGNAMRVGATDSFVSPNLSGDNSGSSQRRYGSQAPTVPLNPAKPFAPSSSFSHPSPPAPPPPSAPGGLFGAPASNPWDGRSAAPVPASTNPPPPPPPASGARAKRGLLRRMMDTSPPPAAVALAATATASSQVLQPFASPALAPSPAYSNSYGLHHHHSAVYPNLAHATPATKPQPNYATMSLADKVLLLISLQDFDGFWAAETAGEIVKIFGWDWSEYQSGDGEAGRGGVRWITLLVVCWLEEKAGSEEGVWELVVEKARGWLEGMPEVAGDVGGGLVGLERKARNEVRRH